jgi:Skp family chaperone for outer membrane proteins
MNRKAWIGMLSLLLASTLVAINGCQKPDESASGKSEGGTHVGTVDLDKVAKGLAWDTQMTENVSKQEKDLKAYYENLKQNLTAQLADKMKSLGIKEGDKIEEIKKRVPEDKLQEFVAMTNQANQMMSMADRELGQVLQKYRSDWAVQYRNALEPTIREVAREKKVAVVMANNPGIMFADPSVDLTDDVVAAARKTMPQLTPVKPVELKNVPQFVPGAATTQSTTKP